MFLLPHSSCLVHPLHLHTSDISNTLIMLRKLLLVSLSLLSAVSATPTPTTTDPLHILALRGIDPLGPIPADATPLPNGGYSFAADSDTAHWVLARDSLPLSKRAVSGLSISMWSNPDCSGSGGFFGNVAYDRFHVGLITNYAAVLYNGRALLDNEQLDFYSVNTLNQDPCGIHVSTAARRSAAGCHVVGRPFGCFMMTKH